MEMLQNKITSFIANLLLKIFFFIFTNVGISKKKKLLKNFWVLHFSDSKMQKIFHKKRNLDSGQLNFIFI